MPGYDVTKPQLRCVLPFEAGPAEVRLLRSATASQLGHWGLLAAADEAELVVTELATNVVRHVGEGASAALVLEQRGERLRIEVHDKSRAVPILRPARCDEECGRGLHLLAALTADWGTVLTAMGKAVWCEVEIDSGQRCRRVERAADALDAYRGGDSAAVDQGRRRRVVLEESAIELIADLLHWTAACGLDPDDILDQAQMHYEAEAA
ncbi:ATP-binding protein [Streptomyces sp. MB09-02B]|uniref:ATP-binding protein n=1 Tax=Streptomyces sp. MB09-02B TaxID=3028667 RepID=UPI0029AC28F1|nr:ATP-binding protein [Streptomyces sp. MB09-02B]MDX3642463.1 ATP-binding protein [Streptomyces sp. MB09-02B]